MERQRRGSGENGKKLFWKQHYHFMCVFRFYILVMFCLIELRVKTRRIRTWLLFHGVAFVQENAHFTSVVINCNFRSSKQNTSTNFQTVNTNQTFLTKVLEFLIDLNFENRIFLPKSWNKVNQFYSQSTAKTIEIWSTQRVQCNIKHGLFFLFMLQISLFFCCSKCVLLCIFKQTYKCF